MGPGRRGGGRRGVLHVSPLPPERWLLLVACWVAGQCSPLFLRVAHGRWWPSSALPAPRPRCSHVWWRSCGGRGGVGCRRWRCRGRARRSAPRLPRHGRPRWVDTSGDRNITYNRPPRFGGCGRIQSPDPRSATHTAHVRVRGTSRWPGRRTYPCTSGFVASGGVEGGSGDGGRCKARICGRSLAPARQAPAHCGV